MVDFSLKEISTIDFSQEGTAGVFQLGCVYSVPADHMLGVSPVDAGERMPREACRAGLSLTDL